MGAALAGTAAMAKSAFSPTPTRSNFMSVQGKEERVDIEPSFWACSDPKDDCSNSGCCKVSGHKCFTKVDGAQCNQTCAAGKEGFTCDIGGYTTIKVEDYNGEFHQIKRKSTKTWVNWGMFYQVWLKVKEQEGVYKADYTVKVDADAVFLPQRLRMYLGSAIKGDSPHGLYLENCQNVQYGFFGHLEVISREGVRVLTSNLEECHSMFAPCANEGCDWKWGAWGEDVFTQRCMDHHYVDKVEAFDMTTDGACAA